MRRLLDLEQELIATASWASSPPPYLARLPLEYAAKNEIQDLLFVQLALVPELVALIFERQFLSRVKRPPDNTFLRALIRR